MQKYNILVLSDSHGNRREIERIMSYQIEPLDAVIHLGDGCNDIDRRSISESCALYSVRGNCDFFTAGDDIPYERTISFGDFTFLIMHGHKFFVKNDIRYAVEYAAGKSVDVLLYGHTHVPLENYFSEGTTIGNTVLSKPLYVFNPGSVGKYPSSFGNIQINDRSILFGFSK